MSFILSAILSFMFEINPVHNALADIKQRGESLRGYL
jgi:hypothetical protein